MTIKSIIETEAKSQALDMSGENINQLVKLGESFLVVNKQINLSAIRDEQGVAIKHVIDSLMLNKFVKLSGTVVDVGTGGGFPALPLAITNPKAEFVLVDSTAKKLRAVDGFIEELGLKNAKTLVGRAEMLSIHKKGLADVVVARAVARLDVLLDSVTGLLKRGGMIYLYKTPSDEEMSLEASSLKRNRLTKGEVFEYALEGQERKILSYSKKLTSILQNGNT
jgi:16S rRNA (guanine527-N7)-methyltransferase